MNKLIVSALVSAGLAAAVPQAIAQTGPEGGPQARPFPPMQHHGPRAFQSPTDRVEAQLAYLKTALKITGDQEGAWNAYADVRRKQARDAAQHMEAFRAKMAEAKKEGPRTPPTAVERLERRQAMLTAFSTRLSETIAATKPLYAALTPDQKKVADELLAPRGRGGFGHRGGHRHGMA